MAKLKGRMRRSEGNARIRKQALLVALLSAVILDVAVVLPGNPLSTNGAVNELKKDLLKAVANGAQEQIFQCARDLEELNVTDAPVGGRWSLTLFSAITAALYRVFFRFAPFLAGSQDRPKIELLGPLSLSVGNEQLVDLASKRVDNRVALRLGTDGPKFTIRVKGDLLGDDARDLEVTFTSFGLEFPNLPSLELPLPRPTGRLRTTFCDSTMRLSRGGRGGLFILKRLERER
eukprot:s2236_g13.t1